MKSLISVLFLVSALLVASSTAQCPDWDYAGAASWGDLCPEYHQCSGVDGGVEQSPVDIFISEATPRPTVSFLQPLTVRGDNTQRACTLANTGKGLVLSVNPDAKQQLQLEGGRISDRVFLDLVRVEIHTPAEHTLNGFTHDLEMQVYFDRPVVGDPTGRNTVAASFFYSVKRKNANTAKIASPVLNQLFFRKKKGTRIIDNVPNAGDTFEYNVNFADINQMFSDNNWVTYDGSKNVPDCDQTVQWYVFLEADKLSESQLQAFQQFGANARPTQPLGSRVPWFFRENYPNNKVFNQITAQ